MLFGLNTSALGRPCFKDLHHYTQIDWKALRNPGRKKILLKNIMQASGVTEFGFVLGFVLFCFGFCFVVCFFVFFWGGGGGPDFHLGGQEDGIAMIFSPSHLLCTIKSPMPPAPGPP